MNNTFESQLSPEDIEKLRNLASISKPTERQIDSLPEPAAEQLTDVDLSGLDERWESKPTAIEYAKTASVKIAAPVRTNRYTPGSDGSIEWSIQSGDESYDLHDISEVFYALLESARESERVAQEPSRRHVALPESEIVKLIQTRHSSSSDNDRLERLKRAEQALKARRRLYNPFTQKLKSAIEKSAPNNIPVVVYENGMKLIAPEVVRSLTRQWAQHVGLSVPDNDRLERHITLPIVVERPDFEKTELKDGETFVRVAEGEEWTEIGLWKRSKHGPAKYSINYTYSTDPDKMQGKVLRVSEWEVISDQRAREEAEKAETEEAKELSRSQIVSTKFDSKEVIVGFDERGRAYVPTESFRDVSEPVPVEIAEPVGLEKTQYIDGEILKPGVAEFIIEAISSDKSAHEISSETGLDQSRIEHLIELRNSWGGAYLAECKIENVTRKHPYVVCVLPEQVEGSVLEHAVAENAEYGNAVFVVRAEQGDWKEVLLDKTKRQAVDLGAKRVPHQGDWRDRVLDVLTES